MRIPLEEPALNEVYMTWKLKRTIVILVITICFSLIATGCHRKTSDAADSNQPSTPKPQSSPLVGFAKDLQFIKNGQYTYIYVFSRKDGKPLEAEDSQFLHTNAPQMVDWAKTEDGKKVIGGTNFNLEEGNMGLLKKRFVVEDYSGK